MTYEKISAESATDESSAPLQARLSKHDSARSKEKNVSEAERLLSGLLGGALLFRTAMHPLSGAGAFSAVLGIACLYRSLGGHCPVYSILGINTKARFGAE